MDSTLLSNVLWSSQKNLNFTNKFILRNTWVLLLRQLCKLQIFNCWLQIFTCSTKFFFRWKPKPYKKCQYSKPIWKLSKQNKLTVKLFDEKLSENSWSLLQLQTRIVIYYVKKFVKNLSNEKKHIPVSRELAF